MHIDKTQPAFVRCPKCIQRQKAREEALKQLKPDNLSTALIKRQLEEDTVCCECDCE
jgi:hypothetical protein